jgi:hypothetical protein
MGTMQKKNDKVFKGLIETKRDQLRERDKLRICNYLQVEKNVLKN